MDAHSLDSWRRKVSLIFLIHMSTVRVAGLCLIYSPVGFCASSLSKSSLHFSQVPSYHSIPRLEDAHVAHTSLRRCPAIWKVMAVELAWRVVYF